MRVRVRVRDLRVMVMVMVVERRGRRCNAALGGGEFNSPRLGAPG